MLRKLFLIDIIEIFSFVILQAPPILAQTQSDLSQVEELAFSKPIQVAHAQNLADAVAEAVEDGRTDVDADAEVDSIAGMRADGMGWGQIAHEIGVHPGTLGHGKGKNVHTATKRRWLQLGISRPEYPKTTGWATAMPLGEKVLNMGMHSLIMLIKVGTTETLGAMAEGSAISSHKMAACDWLRIPAISVYCVWYF